jgi:hypothetical protein
MHPRDSNPGSNMPVPTSHTPKNGAQNPRNSLTRHLGEEREGVFEGANKEGLFCLRHLPQMHDIWGSLKGNSDLFLLFENLKQKTIQLHLKIPLDSDCFDFAGSKKRSLQSLAMTTVFISQWQLTPYTEHAFRRI